VKAIELLESLVEWADRMGGFEAPVWDAARLAVRYVKCNLAQIENELEGMVNDADAIAKAELRIPPLDLIRAMGDSAAHCLKLLNLLKNSVG